MRYINKKYELMLTTRAKAYSSSGSVDLGVHVKLINIGLQIPNYLSASHNDSSVAPPCEWYRLVSQPEIAKKIHKPPVLAFKVIQSHWIRRQSRASVRLPISD